MNDPKSSSDSGDEREQATTEAALVQEIVRSFAGTDDPRLRQVMASLVEHLHAFVRDVRLADSEWDSAIKLLTECGHITDDRRQEFILMSDVLGVSMQTIVVNNRRRGNATESTVFGQFFVEGAPEIALGEDISGGAAGESCWVEGPSSTSRATRCPRPSGCVGSRC